jgi:hypothetical protein
MSPPISMPLGHRPSNSNRPLRSRRMPPPDDYGPVPEGDASGQE